MSKLENSNDPLSRTHALIVLSPTTKLNSNSLTRDGHSLEPWMFKRCVWRWRDLNSAWSSHYHLLIINLPATIDCIHHSFFQVVTSLSSVFCLQFRIWHVSVELEFCTHIGRGEERLELVLYQTGTELTTKASTYLSSALSKLWYLISCCA